MADQTIMSAGRVFITGTSRLQPFASNVVSALQKIRSQNLIVLLGDRPQCIEEAIAGYFYRAPAYPYVMVYTALNHPAIGIHPSWSWQQVPVQEGLKEWRILRLRDQAMVDEADWGLVIYDPLEINQYNSIGINSSPLRNTIRMLLRNKPVKFFYVYEEQMCQQVLTGTEELQKLLSGYGAERLSEVRARQIMRTNNADPHKSASQNKTDRILAKYDEILRSETRTLQREIKKAEKAAAEQEKSEKKLLRKKAQDRYAEEEAELQRKIEARKNSTFWEDYFKEHADQNVDDLCAQDFEQGALF